MTELRRELIAKLEALGDKLTPVMRKQLIELKMKEVAEVRPERPITHKGRIQAAMWLAGCSYGQIARIFGVTRPTVAQAVRNNVRDIMREARPKPVVNEQIIKNEEAALYYRIGLDSTEANPVKLAAEMASKAKAQLNEDLDEDVLDVFDTASAPLSRIGERPAGLSEQDRTEPVGGPSPNTSSEGAS